MSRVRSYFVEIFVQAADNSFVVVDGDKLIVQSSVGEVTVQWGWNRWVAVSVPGHRTAREQVKGRRQLAELLVATGLPETEAGSTARESWRQRPGSSAHGEAEPWGSPWTRLRYGTLAVVLAGLVAMALCMFWLKLYWVAV